ncbi:hypothetical protein [Xanthomonas campestris]|uniref:hypothetical protein n=1 Tax=Xanthomonas campestris TaxID=339 RepID=UPI0012907D55|nr:hypothetical protein [Xanthomonas campestris]
MAVKGKERIFRLTISSLISSSLTARELRELVKYLDGDSEFRYDLFNSLLQISKLSNSESRLDWEEVDPQSDDSDSLLELVFEVLAKKRIAKKELRALLGAINPVLMHEAPDPATTRELLMFFLSHSSTRGRMELMRELGMNVEDDPYLGGIADRTRR